MPPIIIDPRRQAFNSDDARRRRAVFARRYAVYVGFVAAQAQAREDEAAAAPEPLTFDRDDVTFDRSDITFDQTEE